MTERELRKLSRADLLALLVEQSEENEQLRLQLEEAQEKLSSRVIEIEKAGSLAEAALQLNGVFQAAQDACSQYIENMERLSRRQEEICARMEQEQAETEAPAYWENVIENVRKLDIPEEDREEVERCLRQVCPLQQQ